MTTVAEIEPQTDTGAELIARLARRVAPSP